MSNELFNPLEKRNLGESVARALLEKRVVTLANLQLFSGAGIYAIYYSGKFKPYASIAERNRKNSYSQPIYVGKAVPAGARKGGFGLGINPGNVLFNRLKEHAESISAATNLEKGDFACRYLVTDDIWIPLGEALLIEKFSPLWNRLIDGFGNHDPGSGRYEQQRSSWDTLHPGRPWAAKLRPASKDERQLVQVISDFLKGKAVPTIPTESAVIEEP
jgi:hypothetical protein